MKTIEERAKEYAPDPFDDDYIIPAREGHIVNQQREAYIAGAIEQKAIDIDKACEWMMNFKNGAGEFPLYDYIGNFRKAMEE